MDEKIESIIIKYSKRLVEKLIDKYDELGLRAKGDYEKELDYEIDNSKLIIWGAFHSIFMEKGRRKGKRPPIPSIMRWLDHKKGLPPSMLRDKKRTAFAIATKIANEGIKVPNQYNKGKVIKSVIDEFLLKDVNNMIDEIRKVSTIQLKTEYTNIFKKAS
jgi:hypothetical protein